jgi:PAS domain S-box-containing protein
VSRLEGCVAGTNDQDQGAPKPPSAREAQADYELLRSRAEERVAARRRESPPAPSADEARRLLHELQVHQVELEMQNDELRRVQAELALASARYFDMYDLAPVGYCTLSRTGLISEANLGAAALLGVPRSALVNAPLSRFVARDDQDQYYLFSRRLLGGGRQTCEVRITREDGATVWVRLDATVSDGPDGWPVCRIVLLDITERATAEAALRESEARYRLIVESCSDVVFLYDLGQDRPTYVSPSVTRMLGCTIEEALRLPSLFSEESVPARLSAFAAGDESARVRTDRVVLLRKDGSAVETELVTTLITDAQRRVNGIHGVVRDLSQRKPRGSRDA